MKLDTNKLENLILLFAQKSKNDKNFTTLKLLHLLFQADMKVFGQTGKQLIPGAKWIKTEDIKLVGFNKVLKRMIKQKKIELQNAPC